MGNAHTHVLNEFGHGAHHMLSPFHMPTLGRHNEELKRKRFQEAAREAAAAREEERHRRRRHHHGRRHHRQREGMAPPEEPPQAEEPEAAVTPETARQEVANIRNAQAAEMRRGEAEVLTLSHNDDGEDSAVSQWQQQVDRLDEEAATRGKKPYAFAL